jgi:hypothetical protein
MPRPLTTLLTAWFATVANLLVISNLANHHALPVLETTDHHVYVERIENNEQAIDNE